MEMRDSKVLGILHSGGLANSIKVNLADSRVVEIAGIAGFDSVWTDMEHVPNDLGQIEKQVLAAKAYGLDIIVRVPRGSYSSLVWPLEMDASGIMVPHVMSLADARQIVSQVRFHPIGRRPVDGGNADGGFCAVDFQAYLEQANRKRLLILQIEDPEPLAELDEIAALPGVDMLFFGPGDFSQAIGHPGQWDHPAISQARQLVADAAKRHGIWAGTVGSPASFASLAAQGYQFINLGADVVGLSRYFADLVSQTGQVTQEHRKSKAQSGYYGSRENDGGEARI